MMEQPCASYGKRLVLNSENTGFISRIPRQILCPENTVPTIMHFAEQRKTFGTGLIERAILVRPRLASQIYQVSTCIDHGS